MSFLDSLFSSPNRSPQHVVGVDIGSSSIKVVELENRKDVISLVTYGEVQLGPYAGKQIGEPVNLKPNEEQEALVDVIRESAVKARDAVFAMPLSSSFVTNISIPAEADADLTALVRVEARKVIPASLSEVTLDWAEVEVSAAEKKVNKMNKRNVLIAAIQNVALQRFKTLMQFTGMNEPPTEIECFSTIRSLYSAKEKHVAIIDIGATSAKMYITQNGLLARMHRVRAGGAVATKEIAKELGKDFGAIEELKFAGVKDSADFPAIKKAHDNSYRRAFREFAQVLRDQEQKTGNKLQTVYLSGGAALFPGLDGFLKEVIDHDVVLANPFAKVAYPAFMEDAMYEIGPSFTVALGAALRAFE